MWTAPREWPGETAFIVAGGPSVLGEDLDSLKGRRVIAINASFRAVPFADIAFFGDARFGRVHMDELKGFAGRVATCAASVEWPGLLRLKKVHAGTGLATDPAYVVMGRTSTHAAMNLAFHMGAARIVLVGVDMQRSADGLTHHHEPHMWPQRPGCWQQQMRTLKTIAGPLETAGVEVVNTSMGSLVDWWPKRRLADVLAC
jgi:hypothetical protein